MKEDGQLLELIALIKGMVKDFRHEWAKRTSHDLSAAQFRMLYLLNAQGCRKTREFAEALYVTPGAVTGMADKLITKGLISRSRGEEDRRHVHLDITEEGRRLLASTAASQLDILKSLFANVPESDLAHLRRIFTQLHQHQFAHKE